MYCVCGDTQALLSFGFLFNRYCWTLPTHAHIFEKFRFCCMYFSSTFSDWVTFGQVVQPCAPARQTKIWRRPWSCTLPLARSSNAPFKTRPFGFIDVPSWSWGVPKSSFWALFPVRFRQIANVVFSEISISLSLSINKHVKSNMSKPMGQKNFLAPTTGSHAQCRFFFGSPIHSCRSAGAAPEGGGADLRGGAAESERVASSQREAIKPPKKRRSRCSPKAMEYRTLYDV